MGDSSGKVLSALRIWDFTFAGTGIFSPPMVISSSGDDGRVSERSLIILLTVLAAGPLITLMPLSVGTTNELMHSIGHWKWQYPKWSDASSGSKTACNRGSGNIFFELKIAAAQCWQMDASQPLTEINERVNTA
ncbi:hypothetical protein MTO96_014931 [Rhipicephalus appendiculatus]